MSTDASCTRMRLPDINTLEPMDQPSFDRNREKPRPRPFSDAPVTMASTPPDPVFQQHCRPRIFRLSFDLFAASSSSVPCLARTSSSVIAGRRGVLLLMAAFNNRCVIRSVYRRSGPWMGIVSDSRDRSAGAMTPGSSATYSPDPRSLMTASERSGNREDQLPAPLSETPPVPVNPASGAV